MKYAIRYFIPGVLLIGFAFFAGSLSNFIFGLLGFLCFFTVGVTLIAEGWKRRKSGD